MEKFPEHFGFSEEDHAAMVRIHKLLHETVDEHGRVKDNKEGQHLSSILDRLPERSPEQIDEGIISPSNLPHMVFGSEVETVETSSEVKALWYASNPSSCYRVGVRDRKCTVFLLWTKFVYACTDGRRYIGGWELVGVCFTINPCDWF